MIMQYSTMDPQKIAAVLKECAEKYILPRYNTLSADQIQTKTHENDFVTIADIETERALQEILPRMFPGCIVIGEESVSRGEISVDVLRDPTQVVFVVDPVDGTYNFRHGKREFAVMMALVVNGVTQTGWIYDVLGDAHAIVEKGAGAFHNGQRLQVAGMKPDAELVGHIRKSYFPKDMQDKMDYLKPACQSIRRSFSLSCAAHEYLRIAQGVADFSIYGWMKPWDHLAGTLLVQEAGGYVAKWDGTPYVPQDNRGGLTIASSPALWQHVHDKFLKPALNP